MHSALTKPLDWFSIQLARLSVHNGTDVLQQVTAAERLLHSADFFCDFVDAPAEFNFSGPRDFRFPSPIESPWQENNVVPGKLYRCGGDWRARPVVVLVHGWNAETGYRVLFPRLAAWLVRKGVNAAMIELPYHSQRKPSGSGAIDNFLSNNLLHVVQAARQSIADVRAVVAWLAAQGCPRIGLWGISLGAWLTGLLACKEERLDFAVLMTPVARLDRVIDELDFCAPLRRSLAGQPVDLAPLNLVSHRPLLAPGKLLIVASEHDLFAPIETVEELCRAWGGPVLWRPQHGHISVLMSAPVMARTIGWIATQAH